MIESMFGEHSIVLNKNQDRPENEKILFGLSIFCILLTNKCELSRIKYGKKIDS